jgi:hypothetical protein
MMRVQYIVITTTAMTPRRCTALNAVILARLSDLEPMEAVARVIEHCIQAQRIVLTGDNTDQHFVRGVCHCILQVCDGAACL